MKITVDGYREIVHTDHDAFKLAIEKYRDECRDHWPYSPKAKLISKTYVSYRDDERPFYEYIFECSE